MLAIKNILFILTTILYLIACDSKTESSDKILNEKDEFYEICQKSNKLIVKHYNLGNDSSILENLTNVIWIDTIIDSDKIKTLSKLLSSTKKGGYCCCIKTHYTTSFYFNNNILGTYNIDTSDIKNNVIFFDQSYQTSYMISLKDWNTFLKKR